MPQITTLFWDIGGVLLSNGWDRNARAGAVEHFQLDGQEFEKKHQACVIAFETGRLTLDAYLLATIFDRDRDFDRDDVKHFMYAQSLAKPDVLDFARSLHASRRYLMVTLNNESHDLNTFRIERFGLRSMFSLFLSSCFLGVRKPDPQIYRLALELTQTEPAENLFIDDREENLETPRGLGFHTIHHERFGVGTR